MINEAKQHIFTTIKIENDQAIYDCIDTLIFVITNHFIDTTILHLDKTFESMINLHHFNLSHFNWFLKNLYEKR